MPAWLRKRPWVWVIVLFLLVVAVNAAFVVVAERNAPEPAEGVSGAGEGPGR